MSAKKGIVEHEGGILVPLYFDQDHEPRVLLFNQGAFAWHWQIGQEEKAQRVPLFCAKKERASSMFAVFDSLSVDDGPQMACTASALCSKICKDKSQSFVAYNRLIDAAPWTADYVVDESDSNVHKLLGVTVEHDTTPTASYEKLCTLLKDEYGITFDAYDTSILDVSSIVPKSFDFREQPSKVDVSETLTALNEMVGKPATAALEGRYIWREEGNLQKPKNLAAVAGSAQKRQPSEGGPAGGAGGSASQSPKKPRTAAPEEEQQQQPRPMEGVEAAVVSPSPTAAVLSADQIAAAVVNMQSQNASLKAENDLLKATIQSLDEELANLRGQLETAKAAAPASPAPGASQDHAARIAALEAENERLVKEAAALRKASEGLMDVFDAQKVKTEIISVQTCVGKMTISEKGTDAFLEGATLLAASVSKKRLMKDVAASMTPVQSLTEVLLKLTGVGLAKWNETIFQDAHPDTLESGIAAVVSHLYGECDDDPNYPWHHKAMAFGTFDEDATKSVDEALKKDEAEAVMGLTGVLQAVEDPPNAVRALWGKVLVDKMVEVKLWEVEDDE